MPTNVCYEGDRSRGAISKNRSPGDATKKRRPRMLQRTRAASPRIIGLVAAAAACAVWLALVLGASSFHMSAVRQSSLEAAAQPPAPAPVAQARRNILLIISDDLRWAPIFPATPLAPLQGGVYKLAPNLKRLGDSGVVFDRAFTNVPWCGPSRASFLTGREPTETKAYSVEGHFRINPLAKDWRTLPQFFLDHGYKTYIAGKVFHRGSADDQSPKDWTQVLAENIAQGRGYTLGNCIPRIVNERHPNVSWCRFTENGQPGRYGEIGKMLMCRTRDPLGLLDDFVVANAGIRKLREIARRPHPFFMALGFYRPHLPFHVHKDFWDMHETDLIRIPEPQFILGPEPRADMPPEFSVTPDGIESGAQKDAFPPVYEGLADWRLRRAMRVGYAAAISQMDHALGKVLDALEETKLAANTAIVFHGDHGFHLGESGMWYKKLLTDFATHVPFIVRVPWLATMRRGAHVQKDFVELLDVYRTIVDIAGMTPQLPSGIRGRSLVPLLSDPERQDKDNSVSLISRCRSRQCRGMAIEALGFSIRTEQWRYNAWVSVDAKTYAPDFSFLHGEELYNHTGSELEDHFNLQKVPTLAGVKRELLAKLKERYGGVA